MVVSDAASTPSGPRRRRTNSFATVLDFSTQRKQSIGLQRPATEESNLLTLNELPKPTRFRRTSFALSGESPTSLDNLVSEAAELTTQVAASREAARISSIISPPSQSVEFYAESTDTNANSDDVLRKFSVATVVPGSNNFSDSFHRSISTQSLEDPSKTDFGFCTIDTKNSNENAFVWHNTKAFERNPLSSDLVKKYLALVSTENPTVEPEPLIPNTAASRSALTCENLPGMVQSGAPTVASMTIPVHQIRRAHASHAHSSTMKPKFRNNPRVPFPIAYTDTNYSSGLSDAEPWLPFGSQQLDYLSDNYMLDVASEAKQLRLAAQRLEADYHRSTSSLPRSKRNRSRSKLGVPPVNLHPNTPSLRSSKFHATRVYEGLPVPETSASTMTTSTSSSIVSSASFRAPCTTPPHSSAGQTLDSDPCNSLGSGNKLGRLKVFWDQLKPQGGDDSGNYFYLDQQAQERRAKARASNVIAPVSF